MTREGTLLAPIKDLNRATVLGTGYVARPLRRWGLAEREPAFQIQPRIVVVLGLMIVLTLFQLWSSSWGVLPPQYRLSAILASDPPCSSGPRTRHITSLREVSDPGIPITERT